MMLKYFFDRCVSLIGLICLCWVYPLVAILIKIKMPGPVLFVQKRVGKDGKLFNCHKFRTMIAVKNNEGSEAKKGDKGWSTVSVAGEARITPLGAKLRHYKIDELPELWDVFIGKMSFVGPRPDVPGYADKLEGDDLVILKLRPGITGPATLKYRDEEVLLAQINEQIIENGKLIIDNLEITTIEEYNDNVIYPDKVRLNKYYYEHYSFLKDIQMIVCTVLGKKMKYAGEVI